MLLLEEREQIVAFGIKASERGLCPGTSGNISAFNREQGLMAISPSGMNYEDTKPEDIVVMDLSSNIVDGRRKPSSEWGLHSIFYKNRPDVGGIVHTHSLYCTTYAVLGRTIKAVHYAMADAKTAEIPLVPYVLFGTPELAELAYKGCGSANAVLLQNHGIVCLGETLSKAYSLALNTEYTAQLQYQAEAIGEPCALTQQQIDEVRGRFCTYGQTGDKKGGY